MEHRFSCRICIALGVIAAIQTLCQCHHAQDRFKLAVNSRSLHHLSWCTECLKQLETHQFHETINHSGCIRFVAKKSGANKESDYGCYQCDDGNV